MTYYAQSPDDACADADARRSSLAIRVADYVGRYDDIEDVMADSRRIANTIAGDEYDTHFRDVTASMVREVAEDAQYYAAHGKLP